MKALTKDEFLTGGTIPKELVPTPEIKPKSAVWVRGMTGTDRDEFEASIVKTRGRDQTLNLVNIRAKLVSKTACDENGTLLFAEIDIPKIGQKSAAVLQRLFLVAQRLSGIGENDVKELAEGLQENPLEDSASDSP